MTEIFNRDQEVKLWKIAKYYEFVDRFKNLCMEACELVAAHYRQNLGENGAETYFNCVNERIKKLAHVLVACREIEILILDSPDVLLPDIKKAASEEIERQIKRIKEMKND